MRRGQRSGEAHLYRLNHPLAERLLVQAKRRELPPAGVVFNYSDYFGKVTILEPFFGNAGWLKLSQFSVNALDQTEDYLLFAAVTGNGQVLDVETAKRLLTLPGYAEPLTASMNGTEAKLEELTRQQQIKIQRTITERNARFFEQEAEKLDNWADDLKLGLEREIKEIDRQIKEARRAATAALTLEDKLAGQKQIKALEGLRNQKRRSLFDAQDQVDKQREELIRQIENKLNQQSELTRLFTIHWRIA